MKNPTTTKRSDGKLYLKKLFCVFYLLPSKPDIVRETQLLALPHARQDKST